MGVPTFYKWLCSRYPLIVRSLKESITEDNVNSKIDLTLPSENGEFDCLYLDMNGIIHPCCNPISSIAPINEAEMFTRVCDYIDRLFSMIRPRRLLYLAIDGVAPRAKMNQQRSRRYKTSMEIENLMQAYSEAKQEFEKLGYKCPPYKEKWDSNLITPGTPFMERLSACLQVYIRQKYESEPAWKTLSVIFSDANIPGEGEHKILDFIRKQRCNSNYDPNTRHVLYGADADLIMLGLSTHEQNFFIVRESITNDDGASQICHLYNKLLTENSIDKSVNANNRIRFGPNNSSNLRIYSWWKDLEMIDLSVLREYLAYEFKELEEKLSINREKYIENSNNPECTISTEIHEQDNNMKYSKINEKLYNSKFYYDLERCIDDFVFLCFFVGNDFLPNLPAFGIHKGSLDQLLAIYIKVLPTLGDYITWEGNINVKSIGLFFFYLKDLELDVLKEDTRFNNRNNISNKDQKDIFSKPKIDVNKVKFNGIDAYFNDHVNRILQFKDNNCETYMTDKVRLGDGDVDIWRLRYYSIKFKLDLLVLNLKDINQDETIENNLDIDKETIDNNLYQKLSEFSREVGYHYIRGLSWVLKYYYHGVPSWDWFYPYHYAPLVVDLANMAASDLRKIGIKDVSIPDTIIKSVNICDGDSNNICNENELSVNSNTFNFSIENAILAPFSQGVPFSPYQQLMAVLPPNSGKKCLPFKLYQMMSDEKSPLKEFYPDKFKEDPNGNKQRWKWIVLLPFINQEKLLEHVKPLEVHISDIDKIRNRHGMNIIYTSYFSGLSNLFLNNGQKNKSIVNSDIQENKNISEDIFNNEKSTQNNEINLIKIPNDLTIGIFGFVKRLHSNITEKFKDQCILLRIAYIEGNEDYLNVDISNTFTEWRCLIESGFGTDIKVEKSFFFCWYDPGENIKTILAKVSSSQVSIYRIGFGSRLLPNTVKLSAILQNYDLEDQSRKMKGFRAGLSRKIVFRLLSIWGLQESDADISNSQMNRKRGAYVYNGYNRKIRLYSGNRGEYQNNEYCQSYGQGYYSGESEGNLYKKTYSARNRFHNNTYDDRNSIHYSQYNSDGNFNPSLYNTPHLANEVYNRSIRNNNYIQQDFQQNIIDYSSEYLFHGVNSRNYYYKQTSQFNHNIQNNIEGTRINRRSGFENNKW
ncbi:5'-3' exoribonuclease, putative [Cryptosporidium muris RN66]|uniref:5'-3' exoribonuclease n=1 Tax=Cryptosporidium muris (strain RN66) TaxID=441375 RepID=B6AB64_CRYMR|nr:5'-3' exoribonuclease, putative [Cryptosporidium muris RN66]EEA05616.1 5'-3' exoribonuclease, putative [Cryptosporidium muris RN66]|eukprot:XP_002139965.1 5'-3' exoribonuclease [Cryptosporidium muris RN66]